MSIWNQRDNLNLIYKIKTSKVTENKRISTKFWKMDENNQYGNAMTHRCIKKQEKIPSLREFNMILNKLLHTDKIGHLFIADVKVHVKNEKTILFNEI